MKNLFLREGSRVRVKGSKLEGTVLHIEKDVNKINWQGVRPFFIVIMFPDGKQVMASPSQLKRIGKL